MLIFQIKFTMEILDTRERLPKMNRFFNGLIGICLVGGLVSIFIPINILINLVIV